MGWQVAFTTLYEIDGDRKDLEHKYYGLSIQDIIHYSDYSNWESWYTNV